ncbi:MAG: hypothetical protein R3B45_12620 [Bdellovibrionota bacterium]
MACKANDLSLLFLKVFFAFFIMANTLDAASFDINVLPVGKNVTLLKPATTMVPLKVKATLGATDVPQTLSFKSIWNGKGQGPSIRLAIYDSNQTRVRYVEVRPGIPFLYSFRGLSSIMVIPEVTGSFLSKKFSKDLKLQVESDKPLSIGR